MSEDAKVQFALKTLQRFDVVGVYENNPLFLADFARLVGIQPPESLGRVNVTSKRPRVSEITPAFRDRIIALNRLDIRLYEGVVKLIEERQRTGYPIPTPHVPSGGWQKMARQVIIRKATGSLLVENPVTSMTSGESRSFRVTIENKTTQRWPGLTANPVKASYHWQNSSGETHLFEGLRTALPPNGIAPGKTLNLEMKVVAPADPGNYKLVMTMLQEGSSWFETLGFESAYIDIAVG